MKKLFALLLTLAMVLSLAACGGKDAPAPYIYDTEEFLMSDAANEVLVIYGKI